MMPTKTTLAARPNNKEKVMSETALAEHIPTGMEGFAVQASTLEKAYEICEWVSKSPLIPKAYQGKPQSVWVAGAMGAKFGLDLFTSMNGIAEVNGRPCIWGDVLRGLVLARADLEDLKEEFEGNFPDDDFTAKCTIKRKGRSAYTAEFSIADAKKAGLWGKNTWNSYPKDMLLNRAFSRAARRTFSDALSGLSTVEEQQDAQVTREVFPESVSNIETKPAKKREILTSTAEPVDRREDGHEAQQEERASDQVANELPGDLVEEDTAAAPSGKEIRAGLKRLMGLDDDEGSHLLKVMHDWSLPQGNKLIAHVDGMAEAQRLELMREIGETCDALEGGAE